MFAFMFGFMLGGVSGAAIVLAMSPSYQYQVEDGGEPEGAGGVRVRAAEIGEVVKVKVAEAIEESKHVLHQAIEEGKGAAVQRTAELEGMLKQHRGKEEESQA